MTQTTQPLTTFADVEDRLAASLPGYERRVPQERLAALTELTLANGGHAIAEAGCGVGKSLGSLIPAILSGKRTIVATATKALQNQLVTKDVPFLEEHLGVPFTWALLKGRSNYACLAKLSTLKGSAASSVRQELEAAPDHSGDRDDFSTPLEPREWAEMTATGEDCPGKSSCPFGEVCYAERAKAKAQDSQIVIANQALLLSDLKVREVTFGMASMLGDFDAVVIDEAHELGPNATTHLTEEVKLRGVRNLVTEAENLAFQLGQEFSAGRAVLDQLDLIFSTLPDTTQRLGLTFFIEHQDDYIGFLHALEAFVSEASDLQLHSADKATTSRKQRLVQKATAVARRIDELLTANEHEMVRWVEVVPAKRRTEDALKILKTAPINVAPFLQSFLWAHHTAVLVSATMSVGGDFSFLQNQLGLRSAKTLNVGTPFDYKTQALLFVPHAAAPSPKSRGAWMSWSTTKTIQLVEEARGGALLLFTSRTAMQEAALELRPMIEELGYTTMMQGEGTNKELADRFQADTHSCLFALRSFFTGVDFAGDTCRLVVLDKLPFGVPTDPIAEAKAKMIRAQGKSEFADLAMPEMILTLTQAYGRLIRTSRDRGVVAILDSRLSSTSWGKKIVKALPPSPVTTDIKAVHSFFERARA